MDKKAGFEDLLTIIDTTSENKNNPEEAKDKDKVESAAEPEFCLEKLEIKKPKATYNY